jgi:hypothetical protein
MSSFTLAKWVVMDRKKEDGMKIMLNFFPFWNFQAKHIQFENHNWIFLKWCDFEGFQISMVRSVGKKT